GGAPGDANTLTQSALERRPDLFARHAALAEANRRLCLARADRFGNPTIGPAYEYDPARINLIGGQLNMPLPAFNRRQGEIRQAEAELARASAELTQIEQMIRQDVQAARSRLDNALGWTDTYRNQILPNLRS